jgi:carbamoyl-phosphate synthase large subunit
MVAGGSLPEPRRFDRLDAPTRIAVLLTSVGSRVGLVQSFRDAGLSLDVDLTIVTCDLNPEDSAACMLADAAYQVPSPKADNYVDALMEICVTHRIDLIVPTSNGELSILSRSQPRFASIGAHVAISDPEMIALSADKSRTIGFMRNNGFADFVGRSKPRGRHFVVVMFFDLAGTHTTTMPYELLTGPGKNSDRGITRRCAPLIALAKRLAVVLPGPRSVISFHAIVGSHDQITLERINTRFGSGYLLANRAGACFAKWLIEDVRGATTGANDDWKDNVIMLKYNSALFVLP